MRANTVTVTNEWSVPRTLALAGALAVHAFALLLLAMPAMHPAVIAAATETVQIIWHEPEPEPVVQPLPPEPEPLPVPRRPAPRAVAVIETPMSTPTPVAEPSPLPADPILPESTPAPDPGPARAVDVGLAYLSRTEVAYPKASAREREQGTVLLRVHVDVEGRPTAVEVVRGSGHSRLDRAAREAVLAWRFRPVQRNGVAVPASGLVPIEFSLSRG